MYESNNCCWYYKYEIICDIYSSESITYIGPYSNEFLLFGSMKNISSHDYEGYLSQKVLFNDSKGRLILILFQFSKRAYMKDISLILSNILLIIKNISFLLELIEKY